MRKLRMALQGDALEMIEPADVFQLLVEFDDRLTVLELLGQTASVDYHTHPMRPPGYTGPG